MYLDAGRTLTVSPRYFSGRPDPQWQIQEASDTAKLFELYKMAKDNKLLLSEESVPSRLGYQGFIVSDDGMKTYDAGRTLTVSPRYFSGRPDPQWQIQEASDTAKLFELYKMAKDNKLLLSEESVPSRLGYQGFIVSDDGMKTYGLAIGKKTKDLQLQLVEHGEEKGHLGAKIAQNIKNALLSGKCGSPGLGSGQEWTAPLTAAGIRAAAVRDGLIETDPPQGGGIPQIPPQYAETRHLVALVVDPDPNNGDFHWYRLDNNGRWSHKPGLTPIINYDGNGNVIDDPRQAANFPNGPNYRFVCFMTVIKNIVKKKG
ncbi:Insoluble matrix shell protein 1 [Exaiptasia diaphana]|nr:Insoluble matrix shell protein 1 [Exaiptasia diaphana]